MKKGDGEKFDIKGKLLDQIKLTMVIDGYSAPITGEENWWRGLVS